MSASAFRRPARAVAGVDESRGSSRLAALLAIGLVAASGGLLSEVARMAEPAVPAVIAAQP